MRDPKFVTWTRNGKEYRQVSPAYKHELLADYAKRYNLKTFVETGSCNGEVIYLLRELFDWSYTIEADLDCFRNTAERLWRLPVTVIHGDSGVELGKLLPRIKGPALFWLDAHDADYRGPIAQELQAIFDSGIQGVILVDDADYLPDVLPVDPNWKSDGSDFGILRLIFLGSGQKSH